ncbi:MAG: hypothetical protein MK098_09270 [Marinovum sp.]|nr:hypothetical protein [Marinovum sp.]
MRQFVFALTLGVMATSVAAQDEDGLSLMERGIRDFFSGLMEEVDPALEDIQDLLSEIEPSLRSFSDEMGPALRGLMDDIQDWSVYHPPEVLPNGDIILRKKTPEERLAPEEHSGGIDI